MSPASQTPEHMLFDEKTLSWFDWISKAASLGTETSERAAGGRQRASPGALADSGTPKAKSPPAFVRTRKASQGRVEDLSPGTLSRISQISSKWTRPGVTRHPHSHAPAALLVTEWLQITCY